MLIRSRFCLPWGLIALLVALLSLTACSGSSGGGGSSSSSSSSSTRTLNAYVSADSDTGNYGGSCTKLVQDTSSCESARTALGLSGNWLKFSCNVVLGLADSSNASTTSYGSATYVTVKFVDLPDYASNYYPSSGSYSFTANSYTVTGTFSSLQNSYSPSFPDPDVIAQHSITMDIPITPTADGSQTMDLGMIGVSVNGIAIYDNVAATTDNIFAEDGSFDECKGHPSPENGGTYHYHSEPWSISYNDGNLIGVMRDGYFIYGNDTDRTEPTGGDLYTYGGQMGVPPGGSTSTFYYEPTEWKGCYDEDGATKYADDGDPTCSLGTSLSSSLVDAFFLTGHGNGGVFDTPPSVVNNQTGAIRWYYGVPATYCTNCN